MKRYFRLKWDRSVLTKTKIKKDWNINFIKKKEVCLVSYETDTIHHDRNEQ